MEKYIVKQKDLIGDIKGFPIEIVQQMIDYQVEQGNKVNIEIFQIEKAETKNRGGFDWRKTKEGYVFWDNVIINNDFDLFFEKYPKQQEVKQENKEEIEKIIIDGVEIKPGMLIYLDDVDTNLSEYWVVFPTVNELAALSHTLECKWEFIKNLKERITAIRDVTNLPALNGGKLLWEKLKKVTITKQQIADKFGINVEQLEIVE